MLKPQLPWAEALSQQLEQQLRSGRVHHAWLFCGNAGLGKTQLARYWQQRLLCETQSACGRCRPCQLLQAGTHPDAMHLAPEEGHDLKIDQVRELSRHLQETARLGGRKVALIEQADTLNTAAANALLKSLEEPAGNSVLLLTSSRPQALLATLRSRCLSLHLANPSAPQAQAWLAQQGIDHSRGELALLATQQAPLAALELCQSERLAALTQLTTQWLQLKQHQLDAFSFASYAMALTPYSFALVNHMLRCSLWAQQGIVVHSPLALSEHLPAADLHQAQRALQQLQQQLRQIGGLNGEYQFAAWLIQHLIK